MIATKYCAEFINKRARLWSFLELDARLLLGAEAQLSPPHLGHKYLLAAGLRARSQPRATAVVYFALFVRLV